MKTKFIKGITAVCFLASLLFSSCLKDDSHYFNPTDSNTIFAEFPYGGTGAANFPKVAITKLGLDTVSFAVNIATSKDLTTAVTGTFAVDNTLITAYNTANPAIAYQPIPAAAVKLQTSFTVPAGISHSAVCTVIIDRNQLDPAVSYMLPVKIASASVALSSNYNVLYFHIIGNDLAGTYNYDYTRVPASGNFVGHTATLSPVTPTQIEAPTSYYVGERYEITFTKNSDNTYSNFQVVINSDDVANIFTPAGISITTQPAIVAPGYSATTHYTLAQVQNGLLTIQYQVLGGSGARTVTDKFYK